ncbi:hypothetical protein JYU34_016362 [Plutella xylostella]|uniref:HTH TFE/IIEalpha-type domain-containing protein n=1 Tax=Plutella xylostella TaxID=51655 RepID=A0ABQ7Q2F6_PLUXY|nr:hypothetical protein JYU34_016362 [Plutella xylostella]
MTEERLVTEVPSSLKQLARLVVRGFYSIEDALIVDMLVRNPCMKEDDICELLKFERKMLRARIATLKNDKFIQVRLKMETGPDGKAQKVNYYFINYKTFVNVVKYKLDLMRKRMETEERDATSRASFKCPACLKTFTDLEADQLYDMMTQEFRCTFCNAVVEEDQSALPKKDSRLLMAKFNEQLEPLYILLREVEGIKLAPEILEPEPVDINTIRGLTSKTMAARPPGMEWSGEATRSQGLAVEETRVDISIGEEDAGADASKLRKERPVWMVESTIVGAEQLLLRYGTRSQGLAVEETRVDISIGEEDAGADASKLRKERPVWMVESTIVGAEQLLLRYGTRSQGLAVEETRVDISIGEEDAGADASKLRKERPVWIVESTIVGAEQLLLRYGTRSQGLAVEETRVDISIGEEDAGADASKLRKERPVWIVESTIVGAEQLLLRYGTRSQGLAVEETRVDISIGEEDAGADASKLRKERPVWIVESTIVGAEQLLLRYGTRSQGLAVEETRVDISIGEEDAAADASKLRKERPVWMVESTIVGAEQVPYCSLNFVHIKLGVNWLSNLRPSAFSTLRVRGFTQI